MSISIPRYIVGAFLVLLGIGWLLQTAGLVHFDSNIIAPIALIGIGVALVVGSRSGLHVPLFVAGIVLTAVLAGDSGHMHIAQPRVAPRNFNARGGGPYEIPRTALQLRPYDLGAGNLWIDLRQLPLNGETYNVRAHVGTGRLYVLVPPGTSDTINAHVGVGTIDIFGKRSNGAGVDANTAISYAERTKFVLRLRVGAGTIGVIHRRA